jgi:hypothetical protein
MDKGAERPSHQKVDSESGVVSRGSNCEMKIFNESSRSTQGIDASFKMLELYPSAHIQLFLAHHKSFLKNYSQKDNLGPFVPPGTDKGLI